MTGLMVDEAGFVTAVVGSGRCGTTLMMRMLHQGGLTAYADDHGGFETTRWMRLPKDSAWLADCRGRCVKLLEPLRCLPLPALPWRFVLMHRDVTEQARSQTKLLGLVRGRDLSAAIPRLAESLERDLPRMREALAGYGPVHEVAFEDALSDPAGVARGVADFLGLPLDVRAMAAQVIPRPPTCYSGFLELTFLAEAKR